MTVQGFKKTLRCAHLLLQTRTKVLNNELDHAFRNWYPQFRAEAAQPPTFSTDSYPASLARFADRALQVGYIRRREYGLFCKFPSAALVYRNAAAIKIMP
jgi:hypothetical protein